MNPIYRTITSSICNGQVLNEHGEFVDYVDELPGKVTPKQATKRLRNLRCEPNITINNVELKQEMYRLSAKDFMAHAVKVKESIEKEN